MKSLDQVKPLTPELTDELICVPVCVTLRDFNVFMAEGDCGKSVAKAWADLCAWCWRNPQNYLLN